MEREFYFCRLDKGVSKDSKTPYYFIEYVKASDFSIKRDYINAIQFDTLTKKTKGKELQKLCGVLGVDKYDHLIIVDIK